MRILKQSILLICAFILSNTAIPLQAADLDSDEEAWRLTLFVARKIPEDWHPNIPRFESLHIANLTISGAKSLYGLPKEESLPIIKQTLESEGILQDIPNINLTDKEWKVKVFASWQQVVAVPVNESEYNNMLAEFRSRSFIPFFFRWDLAHPRGTEGRIQEYEVQ
jgi:hypothetical protein